MLAGLLASSAYASVFGSVRGLAHDPQHRPVAGAQITIAAVGSSWKQSALTDANGEFLFASVPIGDYKISVQSAGFVSQEKRLAVTSAGSSQIHFPLAVASAHEEVTVSAESSGIDAQSSTSQTTVNREQIDELRGPRPRTVWR